jgi:hypothetical protein
LIVCEIEGSAQAAGFFCEVDPQWPTIHDRILQHFASFHGIFFAVGIHKSEISLQHHANYIHVLREKLSDLDLTCTWSIT